MGPLLFYSNTSTSLNNDLTRRMIYGGTRPCWSLKTLIPDFLLETFECSSDDRYMLYNDELQDCPGYQCRFCPEENFSHVAFVAKEDGRVMIIDTNLSGSSAILTSYKAHNNCIFDAQWVGRDKVLTCSGDSTVRLHSLDREQLILRMASHCGSVKAICRRPMNECQLASCSRDGSVMLWDYRGRQLTGDEATEQTLAPVITVQNAHHTLLPPKTASVAMNARRSNAHNVSPKPVTAITFVDENTLVSCGASDGKIKFWDIRKLSNKVVTPTRTISYPCNQGAVSGYTDLLVNKTGTTLFANCKDNFIYQYDLGHRNFDVPRYRYTGHETNSFYPKIDLSPDEQYLACGSSNNAAYLYRVGLVPQRPIILNGHRDEVTVCRWCPSNQMLMLSISDDCTAMVHRMRPTVDQSRLLPIGHSDAPLSRSSRFAEETVTVANQIPKPKVEMSIVFQGDRRRLLRPLLIPEMSFSNNTTPKKMKNQPISLFRSPMTSNSPAPAPTRPSFQEVNTNIMPHKEIERSRSVLVQQPQKKRPTTVLNTPSDNKENIKRRKTIVTQRPLTSFWPRTNDNK